MRFKLLRKIHHIAKSRIASSKPERVLELITGLTDRFAGRDSGSEDDWAVSWERPFSTKLWVRVGRGFGYNV